MLIMTPPLIYYDIFGFIQFTALLPHAVCSLQSAVCSLQSSNVIHRFRICFSLLGSFHCVYPFPIHPSCMVSILVSTDFQCDNAWRYLLRGCRGYPAQSILPVSWLHLLQAPFPMLIYY